MGRYLGLVFWGHQSSLTIAVKKLLFGPKLAHELNCSITEKVCVVENAQSAAASGRKATPFLTKDVRNQSPVASLGQQDLYSPSPQMVPPRVQSAARTLRRKGPEHLPASLDMSRLSSPRPSISPSAFTSLAFGL